MTLILALPFLLSALTKSIDSGRFLRQILRLGGFPKSLSPILTTCTIAILWFISMALLFGSCLSLAVILIRVFLFIAIVATLVQWLQQQRPSCECYGPALPISPQMSIAIDIALLWGTSFLPLDVCTHTNMKEILPCVLFGIILARISSTKPILDLSKTGIGKKWTMTLSDTETMLVAFVSPECPICAQWLPILYALSKEHSIHIISTTKPEFLPESIRFFPQDRKKILTDIEQFPLVLRIENNIIVKKWDEKPPQTILEEINTTH